MSAPDFIQALPHGIHVVDTGFHRPRFDASYLIVENGRGAFVDVGTNHSVPRLLAAVEHVGLTAADIDYVIVTHVHLDHAGGAGLLMQSLPNARLVAHPRGARHMIDPTLLVQGATAVYGPEEIARSYGTIVGMPAERVLQTSDGMTLALAGREFQFIDTPGHAMHHHCIWDGRSRGFFTGDTFGLSYREFDTEQGAFAMPTTTPVQFQPEALKRSIERMLAYEPDAMYLTHYGRIEDVQRIGRSLIAQIDCIVEAARGLGGGDVHSSAGAGAGAGVGADRHATLKRILGDLQLESLRAHGVRLPRETIDDLLALDLELNAQGTGIWLDRTAA